MTWRSIARSVPRRPRGGGRETLATLLQGAVRCGLVRMTPQRGEHSTMFPTHARRKDPAGNRRQWRRRTSMAAVVLLVTLFGTATMVAAEAPSVPASLATAQFTPIDPAAFESSTPATPPAAPVATLAPAIADFSTTAATDGRRDPACPARCGRQDRRAQDPEQDPADGAYHPSGPRRGDVVLQDRRQLVPLRPQRGHVRGRRRRDPEGRLARTPGPGLLRRCVHPRDAHRLVRVRRHRGSSTSTATPIGVSMPSPSGTMRVTVGW